MRPLFVVAEMQEAKHLIIHYGMSKVNYFDSIDLWTNKDYMLLVTGAGVNNVISSLSKAMSEGILDNYTDIINVGYAGAKELNVGDVVTIKACHCLEFPTKAKTGLKNCMKLIDCDDGDVDCFTSFDFVEKADAFYKCVFDMELAYIARFVYKSLRSIKIVSDNLSYNDFKEFNEEKAWKKVFEKIEKIRKEEK